MILLNPLQNYKNLDLIDIGGENVDLQHGFNQAWNNNEVISAIAAPGFSLGALSKVFIDFKILNEKGLALAKIKIQGC